MSEKMVRTDSKKPIILSREKWLFENKSAMKKLKKGLQDLKEGPLVYKGSFAKFTIDPTE